MKIANPKFDAGTEAKYQAYLAFKEHLLHGHAASGIEAMLLFGVQSPTRAITRLKREGYFVKSQRVPMAKIIRRVNNYTSCSVPDDLPYQEINMLEYWVDR